MRDKPMRHQSGASLIEILVTILILSFGMLALSGMMAYAVQMPKFSAYRATAVSIAAGHIERMRANVDGFQAGGYNETMTFAAILPTVSPCAYPACDAASIATRDKNETNQTLRRELPQGGMRMICNGACNTNEGYLWVIWQEPTTFAAVNASEVDQCPDPAEAPSFTAFTTQPRCILIRFRL